MANAPAAATSAADAPDAAIGSPPPGGVPVAPAVAATAPPNPGPPNPGLPKRNAPAPTGWLLAVSADAGYHARMQAMAEPDAAPIAFPAFVPPRRFALQGTQVLIGRPSRSRGIEPEIDLSGPPADPAVSHAHAMLLAQPDGFWAVVDLDSANGTYVNDEADAIESNTPRLLDAGDRIYVGAWTLITLSRG
jgi:pSer/pThr/pTyr-binding forkhead associated (FHA) protein